MLTFSADLHDQLVEYLCTHVVLNSQGHPTTVPAYIYWKHFLGYPEYF